MLEKISPADALRRIADNLDEGKPMYLGILNGMGKQWHYRTKIDEFMEYAYIKKPTRTITLELPMPLTVEPERCDEVWIGDRFSYARLTYYPNFKNSFFYGNLYATEEDAKAAHEELKAAFSIDNIIEGEFETVEGE